MNYSLVKIENDIISKDDSKNQIKIKDIMTKMEKEYEHLKNNALHLQLLLTKAGELLEEFLDPEDSDEEDDPDIMLMHEISIMSALNIDPIWFGIDPNGKKICISQDKIIKAYPDSDIELHVKTYNSVVLPNGARLAKTKAAAEEMHWSDILDAPYERQ